jgi:hypothetical protein
MNLLNNFSVDHFVDKTAIKEFECPICLNIMLGVCELNKCGHLFCSACINKINKCSVCQSKEIKYHHSEYLTRKVFNFKVNCYIEGCGTVFKLAEAEEHLNTEHYCHKLMETLTLAFRQIRWRLLKY